MADPLWPRADTLEQCEAFRDEDRRFRPGVEAICHLQALDASSVQRLAGGSLPVYAVGDGLVLKVFPPFDLQGHRTESLVLQVLDRRLPVPTPSFHAAGDLEGWGYLLMGRLAGETLASAWPRIPAEDRFRLADGIGRALAALHAVRDARLEALRQDWTAFVEEQRRGCVERQRARGLDGRWLEQIPAFLATTPLEVGSADSLLHTEVMREHLLVRQGPAGWEISGLFDFEPSTLGPRDYEFVAVGLFLSCGDPILLRRILLAGGVPGAGLNAALSRRLMAWCLLHRYSNLAWYLRRIPPPPEVRTLEALAEWWWGFGRANPP